MLSVKKNKKAFTIIEIVITLAISAVIFSGALPLIFKTTTANKAARLRLNAYEAAHQEVENMRGSNLSTLVNHPFAISNISGATGQVIISDNINGSPQTNIVSVVSRVTWTFKNKTETVELKTYLYGDD